MNHEARKQQQCEACGKFTQMNNHHFASKQFEQYHSEFLEQLVILEEMGGFDLAQCDGCPVINDYLERRQDEAI